MSAIDQISGQYRELIETASLDWQVAEYVRTERVLHEHSANEIKLAAIREVAIAQHGEEVFVTAVAAY